jgi:glutamine cyclotransferase
LRRTLGVRANGLPLRRINDLEYIGDTLYANVWYKSHVFAFSPHDGRVVKVLDCSHLVAHAAPRCSESVLNGLAYNPERKSLFLTGKFWPEIFEVGLE